MSNLVIVESPVKATTIKNYLGSGYRVVASKGHVRDLPKSSLGVDIDNNFEAHYINIRGKGDLIKELKKEVKKADKVFLATDPDREGEAISWHLATALNLPDTKTKRVTFNEITKTAIKAAIKAPRDIDMELVNSQQARRILDRIVGYRISPLLWKTVRSGLSAGRVQSVATRIIVERENEIRAFVPREFWTVDAFLKANNGTPFKARYNGKTKKSEITEAEANAVVAASKDSPFTVDKIKREKKTKSPLPPFTTSTMQQDASRKLGFQSARIMRVAQELYEGVNLGSQNGGVQGLITYMRTDSLRVSSEAADSAKEFITSSYGEEYYPEKQRVYKTSAAAQDAHEAIRPANLSYSPASIKDRLSADQYKLYTLIWNRFIASQMASAKIDTIAADIVSAGNVFHATGSTVTFKGYTAVYSDSDAKDDCTLPPLSEGDVLTLEKLMPEQHFTEPPPRYNEASLIKFLEEKGIGRPSTYTPIITTIITRGYVCRDGKALKPTPLGEVTTNIMVENFPDIVNYEFTAEMEDSLDSIARGDTTLEKTLGTFWQGFEPALKKAEETIKAANIEILPEETDIVCDKCGAKMIIKNGRFGKFAACPNYPECKNTKPLAKDGKSLKEPEAAPEETDMKCDKCGGNMVLRAGRYGSFYACSNYPDCKNTKKIVRETGVSCPLCGAMVVVKRGKRNSVFYSCERYPDCNFSSWDLPTNEKCPECGEILYEKKGKLFCRKKECGYKQQ